MRCGHDITSGVAQIPRNLNDAHRARSCLQSAVGLHSKACF